MASGHGVTCVATPVWVRGCAPGLDAGCSCRGEGLTASLPHPPAPIPPPLLQSACPAPMATWLPASGSCKPCSSARCSTTWPDAAEGAWGGVQGVARHAFVIVCTMSTMLSAGNVMRCCPALGAQPVRGCPTCLPWYSAGEGARMGEAGGCAQRRTACGACLLCPSVIVCVTTQRLEVHGLEARRLHGLPGLPDAWGHPSGSQRRRALNPATAPSPAGGELLHCVSVNCQRRVGGGWVVVLILAKPLRAPPHLLRLEALSAALARHVALQHRAAAAHARGRGGMRLGTMDTTAPDAHTGGRASLRTWVPGA